MHNIADVVRQRVERVIVENELLRAGFAAFPYLVMREKKLSMGARLTYAFLLMYAWQEGSCFASQQKMADDVGVSRAQAQRYLYELRDAGWIAIEREDKRYNNIYRILDKKPTKLKARRHGVEADAS